jgi:hypothetical protein
METYQYIITRHAEHGVPALAGIVATETAEPVMPDHKKTADVEVVVIGGGFDRDARPAHGTAPNLQPEDGAVLVGETLYSGEP